MQAAGTAAIVEERESRQAGLGTEGGCSRKTPERRPAREGFSVWSLLDWLKAADRAGVPAVPACVLAWFEKYDVLHDDVEGPHAVRLDAAFAEADRRTGTGYAPGTIRMRRWEHCGTALLKCDTADSGDVPERTAREALDLDTRVVDLLADWPDLRLAAVERPWVRGLVRGGRPEEYRVFVTAGEVTGVSAYYPQAHEPGVREHAVQAMELTKRVLAAVRGPLRWNEAVAEKHTGAEMRWAMQGLGGKPDPRESKSERDRFFDATVDWLTTPDGPVLLEGGPGVTLGAHPCCFGPESQEGIALSAAGN